MSLSRRDQGDIEHVVELLASQGVLLARPHSGDLGDGFRELRPRAGRSPLRVAYVFDPNRSAVLLIGGGKTDAKMYRRLLARAKAIYAEYLKAIAN